MIAVAIAGCSAKRLSYSPVFQFTVEEARAVVARGFEEQHPAYRPTSVEVTDDKINLLFHHIRTKRGLFINPSAVTVPEGKTLYLDDLGITDLSYKKGYYIVRIYDRSPRARLRVYFRELPKAERFSDAIAVLEREFAP